MKIYVAERVADHEGFEIIGLFSTRAAAQAACDADVYDPRVPLWTGKPRGDSYEIEEFELDLPPEGATSNGTDDARG